jgi:hypothetical protein
VIVAHHGLGEELILSAVAGGASAGSAILVVWRAQLSRAVRWLRRR